jgi:triphosphoribosyl-dephospho-CoA synthase
VNASLLFAPAPSNRRGEVWDRADELAEWAVAALVTEALLTPKPALVDQRGPGAHRDLNLELLLKSAAALRGSFRAMAVEATGRGIDRELREKLGAIGRDGEVRMLAATGGSNAHRGAIWVLGLLVASVAAGETTDEVSAVAARAALLASLPDRHAPVIPTNGLAVGRRFGVTGARGEALAGFPNVLDIGLPALYSARARGIAEDLAQLDALMAIMSRLDDTCLLHRGGWPALAAAQSGAREVLKAGGTVTQAGQDALLLLDADLVRRYASPGGSADLLAACLFLDRTQPRGVRTWSG